ncbi:MAG: hypothetical protein QGH58_00265 [Arenicellales bacterium]|nr:hypothetical protein [Arenicellales bacterium]
MPDLPSGVILAGMARLHTASEPRSGHVLPGPQQARHLRGLLHLLRLPAQ